MENIDASVLRWFGNDGIAKRVYVKSVWGTHLAGQTRKRWVDSVNDCLKKKSGLSVRHVRRVVYDRDECRGFVRWNT